MEGEDVVLDGFNDTCLPSGRYDFRATRRIAKGQLANDCETEFDSEQFRIERKLTVSISDTLGASAAAEAKIPTFDSS